MPYLKLPRVAMSRCWLCAWPITENWGLRIWGLIQKVQGWCIVRFILALLSLAPVADLVTDVWSFAFFVWEEWWVSAWISFIVIYLSWRFFFVYACMHWPTPTLKVLLVLYIPGLILPFWFTVINVKGDLGGAPPSPEAEGEDPENPVIDDSEP